ncbi:MAG: dUTPase [Heliobacteriaceae bacterium]|nr:dUTPase [Heliobacteriaceae bacterium]MDD4586948.1 dUTPase [Heliobacteriaceae bacterium]
MDRLEQIFQWQAGFDADLIKRRQLEDITFEEWIQKETLALMSELAELLDEVNFKWWKNPKPVDREAVKEELVDILHFFVSMCLKAGITPQELFEAYHRKNQENRHRQDGTSLKAGYTSPPAVDD